MFFGIFQEKLLFSAIFPCFYPQNLLNKNLKIIKKKFKNLLNKFL